MRKKVQRHCHISCPFHQECKNINSPQSSSKLGAVITEIATALKKAKCKLQQASQRSSSMDLFPSAYIQRHQLKIIIKTHQPLKALLYCQSQ
ncbi:hypothetical protein L195_g003040 [Trifolium pratense]|uniref:Uncharacterized protein n=1 Tax=Trifolium pratense TaxID=57577 RepID=A0A2K3NU51_TRIPR|nr:hypothetical protein L195_g003040 [Trifolium pratense]